MPAAQRPLTLRFLVFLLPLMLSNVLQSLNGTINTIYIGQMIGVEALAAVSVFFPIMLLLISFIIGLASGATVLIGQAWGARNVDKVKEVTGTTLVASFLAGLVVALFGGLFAGEIMATLGTPETIAGLATDYGRVMLIGMPGVFIFMVVTSVLRGVGDTVTPLVSLVISILCGLLITPALIQGWGGLPQLGVVSAAVATIAGFMLVLVFLFFYLRWRKHPMAPDRVLLGYLRINGPLFLTVLRLGVPAGIQMVVASLAGIIVVGLVTRFGPEATAAYGALNQVLGYVQFPAMSIAIASSIFAAQAIGAGDASRLGAITRTGLLMNLVLTGGLVLIAYLFSERLVALFITDPEVVDLTQELLHIVLWSVVLFGMAQTFTGVMRAAGTVWVPMFIGLGAILLIEVPGAIWLSHTMGLEGIWVAYATAFTAMMLMQGAYYWFVWRKRPIRKLV
ncbi:MAG: MATE family efflux transporter [Devosia sp.]